jgi:hypothetical protein
MVGGAAAAIAEESQPAVGESVHGAWHAVALLEHASPGERELSERGGIGAAPHVDRLVGVGDDDRRVGVRAPLDGEREFETAEVLRLVEQQHARRDRVPRDVAQALLDEVGEVEALGALLPARPGGEVVALLGCPHLGRRHPGALGHDLRVQRVHAGAPGVGVGRRVLELVAAGAEGQGGVLVVPGADAFGRLSKLRAIERAVAVRVKGADVLVGDRGVAPGDLGGGGAGEADGGDLAAAVLGGSGLRLAREVRRLAGARGAVDEEEPRVGHAATDPSIGDRRIGQPRRWNSARNWWQTECGLVHRVRGWIARAAASMLWPSS